MIAAELANMRQGERTDISPIGGKLSQPQAADLLNVSKRSVERATKVKTEGSENLKQAVKDGGLKVSVAADLEIICGEMPH